MYIYAEKSAQAVANESPYDQEVWFDDFKVEVTKSPVAAVSDYYPFGMLQAGNSTNSGDPTGNKYLYNGNEIQVELGLNLYDFNNRFYGQELGRFVSIDRLADSPEQFNQSPYQYGWNNPIKFNDPDGDCPNCFIQLMVKYMTIAKKAEAPANRLLNGTSGDIPNNVKVDSRMRSTVKASSTIQDANAVAETGKELSREITMDVAEGADVGGQVISDAGLVAAPFTGGASLSLVPIGEGISATGKGVKILIYSAEENYDDAAIEGANLLISYGTNSLTSSAVKQTKKVGSFDNAQQEMVTEGVLGSVGNAWNKLSSWILSNFDDEEDE